MDEKVSYLHISPSDSLPEMQPVFWHHTIAAMNDNRFGTTSHIDSRAMGKLGSNWWEPYREIKKLAITEELDNFEFIGNLHNLRSLSIIHSKTFSSLHLIENLEKLEFLELIQCYQISDITPIITLRNKQYQKQIEARAQIEAEGGMELKAQCKCLSDCSSLSNINLTDCNISTLEPFRADKGLSMDELHLSWNHIKDVSPLGVKWNAYLSLSHNQIEDISPLFTSVDTNYYGINLQHNLIQDISNVKISQARIPARIKIWIDNNQIPPQQLEKWRKNKYIWLFDV